MKRPVGALTSSYFSKGHIKTSPGARSPASEFTGNLRCHADRYDRARGRREHHDYYDQSATSPVFD
jgi:hypothetical protein